MLRRSLCAAPGCQSGLLQVCLLRIVLLHSVQQIDNFVYRLSSCRVFGSVLEYDMLIMKRVSVIKSRKRVGENGSEI